MERGISSRHLLSSVLIHFLTNIVRCLRLRVSKVLPVTASTTYLAWALIFVVVLLCVEEDIMYDVMGWLVY